MNSLLLLGFASLALSLFLTPFVGNLALRLGLLDHLDSPCKIHKLLVPRMGGVAILTAAIGAHVLLMLS